MAIGMVLEFQGATQAQYDAVIKDMDLGGKPGPGGIFHAAGPIEGGWIVTDVWESQEAFEKFNAEKIGPLTQKHGIAPPKVTVFPVHNMLTP